MNQRKNKIIFLNQMAGPLFRELAEDLANIWYPSMMYTGHSDTIRVGGNKYLRIKSAPAYNRAGLFSRLLSWIKYFFKALLVIWQNPKSSLIFIVSNPPFLGFAGLLYKLLRGQQYMVLVYDIYPDLLIGLGRLRRGLVSNTWDVINRIVYRHAIAVITIGPDMARRLKAKISGVNSEKTRVFCIPPWADVKVVRPIPKAQNWFAQKYDLLNKTIVLYSGNMGHTHDIETIIEAAMRLSDNPRIHFLFIGEGAKWNLVQEAVWAHGLKNVTLLPFQKESTLPYSIASGDIGIVTYQKGTEGCMQPSKAFYYMAAGLVPIILNTKKTSLDSVIQKYQCGKWVKNGDIGGLIQTIENLHTDVHLMGCYKEKSRELAVKLYSRNNSSMYINLLERVLSC